MLFALFLVSISNARVKVYRGDSFRVPRTCKHLAILGSTPHPTQFIANQTGTIDSLKKIKLSDFMDVEYLRDSYKNALFLCMHNQVDHLLIAYLPAHFVELRADYDTHIYVQAIRNFLKSITPQIKALIREVAQEIGCITPVTLVTPNKKGILRVPSFFESKEQKVQHYIRSFPHLKGIRGDTVMRLSIINNQGAEQQNEKIIRYLSYEYLFEGSLNFTTLELDKKTVHKYL